MELGIHYIAFLPGPPETLDPTLAATARAAEDAGATMFTLACQRQPVRRPPILIGGDGEEKTLRSVDQYAALGFELVNSGPVPGDPDSVGWVKRLGDEVIPRLPH